MCFDGRADYISIFADESLMGCKEKEESDDFRSKQLVVDIGRDMEACKRSFGRQNRWFYMRGNAS